MSVPPFSHKIVHFYVDKALGWEHCKKTFQTVEALKDKYNIESVCLDGSNDYAYFNALAQVWGLGNLVTIEEDIIFTEKQLLELLKCKQTDCAFAFKLYPVTTMLDKPVWSIGENLLPQRIRLYTLEERPKFCNFTSLGFTKLSKETQNKINISDLLPWTALSPHWKFLDLVTVGRIPDLKVHVHYEVEHGHEG